MSVSNYRDKNFIKLYKKRPIAHDFVIFPALLKLLGSIRGKHVLDLGCGSGDFARILALHGAKVTAVDQSREWVKICKSDNADLKDFKSLVADGANLSMIKNNSFDLVIMNMVFLNISSKKKVALIMREVGRVLKRGGHFIFSDLHPITLMTSRTNTEHLSYTKDFSYFKDGSQYVSRVLLNDGRTITFSDIHWTLETYITFMRNAGMSLESIIEPKPINSAPSVFSDYRVPEYIILKCRK